MTSVQYGDDYPAWEQKQDRLFEACRKGNLEYVKHMIEVDNEDVNQTDDGGGTALHFAALKGQAHIVRYLLEKGASPQLKTEMWGHTALHWAAHDNQTEVVKVLIYYQREKGITLDLPSNSLDTPLIVACYQGHLEPAKILIENGAGIKTQGLDGRDACNWAAKRRHAHIVEYLVGVGADIEYHPEGKHKSVVEIGKKHKKINTAIEKGLSTMLSKKESGLPLVNITSLEALGRELVAIPLSTASATKAQSTNANGTVDTSSEASSTSAAAAEPTSSTSATPITYTELKVEHGDVPTADQFSGFRRDTLADPPDASVVDPPTTFDTITEEAEHENEQTSS